MIYIIIIRYSIIPDDTSAGAFESYEAADCHAKKVGFSNYEIKKLILI
jgi:hypothetical protein